MIWREKISVRVNFSFFHSCVQCLTSSPTNFMWNFQIHCILELVQWVTVSCELISRNLFQVRLKFLSWIFESEKSIFGFTNFLWQFTFETWLLISWNESRNLLVLCDFWYWTDDQQSKYTLASWFSCTQVSDNYE